MSGTSETWDRLADVWEFLEPLGLCPSDLSRFVTKIGSRVLVVGSGQGSIVEALRRLGHSVCGVDFSIKMIRRGRERRGIEAIQAKAEALPFARGLFQTVVVATGVLDPDEPAAVNSCLAECQRVSTVNGYLLIAFPTFDGVGGRVGIELGYIHNGRQSTDRLLTLWEHGQSVQSCERVVQHWRNCSSDEARRIVGEHWSIICGIRRFLDKLATSLAGRREIAIQYLRELDAFRGGGFSVSEAKAIARRCGLEPRGCFLNSAGAALLMLARRFTAGANCASLCHQERDLL
jgi:SAM-dependent methyltransferase